MVASFVLLFVDVFVSRSQCVETWIHMKNDLAIYIYSVTLYVLFYKLEIKIIIPNLTTEHLYALVSNR